MVVVMVQHVRRAAIRRHVGHAVRHVSHMMRRHVVVGVHVVGRQWMRVRRTGRPVHVVRHDPRTQVRQRRAHVVACARVAAGRAVQMAIRADSGGQQTRRVRSGRRAGTGRDGAGARHVRRSGRQQVVVVAPVRLVRCRSLSRPLLRLLLLRLVCVTHCEAGHGTVRRYFVSPTRPLVTTT